jgi:hypothetical protein
MIRKKFGSCVVSPKNLLGNFKLLLKILFHVGTVKITEISKFENTLLAFLKALNCKNCKNYCSKIKT